VKDTTLHERENRHQDLRVYFTSVVTTDKRDA